MTVHRLDAPAGADGCPAPENVHTAAMDGGPVYGTDATYLREVLREPDSCRLRASKAGMLPITSSADSKGRFFFVAGDLRVDEHGLLTCMHTVRPSKLLGSCRTCCAVLCCLLCPMHIPCWICICTARWRIWVDAGVDAGAQPPMRRDCSIGREQEHG